MMYALEFCESCEQPIPCACIPLPAELEELEKLREEQRPKDPLQEIRVPADWEVER